MPDDIKNIEEREIIKSETQGPKDTFYSQPFDFDLKLSGKKKKELAKDVCDKINKSIGDSTELFNQCKEWGRRYKGEVQKKNTPWPNSANTNVRLCTMKLDGIVDKISGSISEITPNYIFSIEGMERDKLNAIEEWYQSVLDKKIKYRNFLENNLHNAGKQKSGMCMLIWEKDVTRRRGYEVFQDDVFEGTRIKGSGLTKFKNRYSSYKIAKCTKQEYKQIISNLKEYGYCKINISYNHIEEGPKLENIERYHFILLPANAKTQKEAEGEFVEINKTRQDLLRGVKDSKYEKEDIDSLFAKLDRKGKPKEEDIRKCYMGRYQYGEEDEIKKDIFIMVDIEAQHIIRISQFPYFNNESFFYQTKLKTLPDEFDGISIVDRLSKIEDEINTEHNQRIDAWTLILTKIFLINGNAEFPEKDPRVEGITPGDNIVVTGVSLDNAIQELIKLPIGIPNFINEEKLLLQFADWLSGLSAGLSGQSQPLDPNAPASKTLALLREASVRIASYIRNIRIGLNEIGKGILWRYYQYGPDTYTWNGVEFTREDINPDNIELDLRISEANMNKDLMKQEILFILNTVLSVPIVQQNMLAQQDVLSQFLKVWKYPGEDEIVSMTQEDVIKLIMQRMKEAQELQAQEEQKAKEEELDKVGDEIVKQTEKMNKKRPGMADEVLNR